MTDMTPTNRLREAFEAWAGKRESAPTTSAWDYAFKAWQAATLAERVRWCKPDEGSALPLDKPGKQAQELQKSLNG